MNSNKSISVCIDSKFDLKQVLDEIFMDPLNEGDEEDHLEEDYSYSTEYSPELDEEVPNEVTDTRNEPVRSTYQSCGFHRIGRAGLRGGFGCIPGSFALLLCYFF